MSAQLKDLRHNARMIVLQKLFLENFHQKSDIDTSGQAVGFEEPALMEIDGIPEFDKEFSEKVLKGVWDNLTKIDEIIAKLAPEWPINNIATTDLQIIRIAVCEGFILKLTPEKVAVDEAIELAKEFSNDHSRMFVSGVLGNLIAHQADYL
jgi:N utilization substance protein B